MATVIEEAWWLAMLAGGFRNGSLIIEDSTLNVSSGSSVNLRVKLSTRPRNDISVSLSESSNLITLGATELTFTQSNWDAYQNVLVSAAGNSQTLSLPSSWYSTSIVNNIFFRGWQAPTPRPQINSVLTDGNDRYFGFISGGSNDTIDFGIINMATGGTSGGSDLSDAFEQSGSIVVTVSGISYTFVPAGVDMSSPYRWTPSNTADVEALYNALVNSISGSLTILDYTPGTANIGLAASGAPEFNGETASVTVTVS